VYQVTAQVTPAAHGTLLNTALITLGNLTDPNTANNVFTDLDTLTSAQVDVRVTKTDGLLGSPIVSGDYVTYTIQVANFGPSDAPLGTISVVDDFPPELDSISWTCLNAPNCSSSGTTKIADSSVILPYLGTVTYVVNARVLPNQNSSVTNWASIFVYNNTNSTDSSDDITFVTTNIRTNADITISKSNGVSTVTPGLDVTYTINVFNRGPSDANGVVIKDTFSSQLQNVRWSCIATARATCPASSGTGDINVSSFIGTLNNVTFTVTARVSPSAFLYLVNEASANSTNSDSDYSNNIATDTDDLYPVADLSIIKSDNQSISAPGATLTYTIIVTNSGPSDVRTGVSVIDSFSSFFTPPTNWDCVASNGLCTS